MLGFPDEVLRAIAAAWVSVPGSLQKTETDGPASGVSGRQRPTSGPPSEEEQKVSFDPGDAIFLSVSDIVFHQTNALILWAMSICSLMSCRRARLGGLWETAARLGTAVSGGIVSFLATVKRHLSLSLFPPFSLSLSLSRSLSISLSLSLSVWCSAARSVRCMGGRGPPRDRRQRRRRRPLR